MVQGGMEEVASALRESDDVVICGHVSPDGDCIGSQLALAWALRALGKHVTCVLAKPEEIFYGLRSLPGADEMVPACEFEGDVPVFVSVDVPDPKRMGDGAQLHARAAKTIAIDHHLPLDPFASTSYIDSDAPASALIIWNLLPYLGVEPDERMATCCFTGLSSDTGSFCYQNTTDEVFCEACRMVQTGANPAEIAHDLYQNRSYPSIQLEARMIERMTFVCDGKALVSYLTVQDFEEIGATRADAEPLIDTLRSIRGPRIACILREQADCIRGSIRSKDDTNVAVIARVLGGGGHEAAAGFTVHGSLADAQKALYDQLEKTLN